MSIPVLLPMWLFYDFFISSTRLGRWIDQQRFRSRKSRWPRTVEEAVQQIYQRLSRSDLELLLNSDAMDLVLFEMNIRGAFGLWDGNDALLKSCGVENNSVPADSASGVIMQALVERVRHESLD
jgi:hypothetical protein